MRVEGEAGGHRRRRRRGAGQGAADRAVDRRAFASSRTMSSLLLRRGCATAAPSTSPPPTMPRISPARVLVFAASGDEALDRRVSEDARRLGLTGQRRRPAGTLRFLHAGAGQPRAGLRSPSARRAQRPCCRSRSARRIDRMLSPSLGALASLAETFRGSAERLLPKGTARRRFWNDFFNGAPARATGNRPAIDEAREAAAELLLPPPGCRRPYRAGRRRSWRRRPSDAARPAPADGSRRHRL